MESLNCPVSFWEYEYDKLIAIKDCLDTTPNILK